MELYTLSLGMVCNSMYTIEVRTFLVGKQIVGNFQVVKCPVIVHTKSKTPLTQAGHQPLKRVRPGLNLHNWQRAEKRLSSLFILYI